MVKSLLRLALLMSLLTIGSLTTARADEAADAHALIQRQLDAFESGDAGGAYALAAPGIKSIFPDSGIFMEMVRTRYAPVYHHRSSEFGAYSLDGDNATQILTFVDDNNEVWTALYKLARQPDGSWLISGCLLVKSDAKDS